MVSALAWIVVGGAVMVASHRLKFGGLHAPGPGFLPMLTGAVMLVLGAAVFVQEWRRRRETREGPEAVGARANWVQVVMAIGALVAYDLLLDHLGYMITTLLVMGFLFRFVAHLRWPLALVATAAAAFLSYALFVLWLKVRLPPGTWGG